MSFDPRKVYKLSLDCFKDVPENERPVFFYRRINGSEYLEISRIMEAPAAGVTVDVQCEQIYNALHIGLTDWKCQTDPASGNPVEFDPARLPEVLDPMEARELVNERLFAARLSGPELKNSAPQS